MHRHPSTFSGDTERKGGQRERVLIPNGITDNGGIGRVNPKKKGRVGPSGQSNGHQRGREEYRLKGGNHGLRASQGGQNNLDMEIQKKYIGWLKQVRGDCMGIEKSGRRGESVVRERKTVVKRGKKRRWSEMKHLLSIS